MPGDGGDKKYKEFKDEQIRKGGGRLLDEKGNPGPDSADDLHAKQRNNLFGSPFGTGKNDPTAEGYKGYDPTEELPNRHTYKSPRRN